MTGQQEYAPDGVQRPERFTRPAGVRVDPPAWMRATALARIAPSFLVIGAMRSGSTELYRFLAAHPRILPPLRKEVHYFDFQSQLRIDHLAHRPVSGTREQLAVLELSAFSHARGTARGAHLWSDGCFGTVRTGWMAQFRAPKRPKRPRFGPLKCRWVSPGGLPRGNGARGWRSICRSTWVPGTFILIWLAQYLGELHPKCDFGM